MGRRLLIVCAVGLLVLSGTALAAVEQVKVSGDIEVQAIGRNLSLGSTEFKYTDIDPDTGEEVLVTTPGTTKDQENFIISQTRVRVDADLTENVSAVVRLINERLWGEEETYRGTSTEGGTPSAPFQIDPTTGGLSYHTDYGKRDNSEVAIDLAYIKLAEFFYQPLTVIVGRQNLRYGNAMIVGDPDTNQCSLNRFREAGDLSKRKSFDAVREILDFAPFTIESIYAKVYEGDSNRNDDVTLIGEQLAYQWSGFNGVSELYYFGSILARSATEIVQGHNGDNQPNENQLKTHCFGGRFQFDPNENLTFGLEGAYQFGNAMTDVRNQPFEEDPLDPFSGPWYVFRHLSAFAGQFISEYRILNNWKPKFGFTYSYFSGDRNPTTGDPDDPLDPEDPASLAGKRHHAWDPMYEDQSPAEIINILMKQSNAQYIRLTGSFMPREDITLGMVYCHARLADSWGFDKYYPLRGPAYKNHYQVDKEDKHFGDEIDAYGVYDYTEDVQFKLIGACFIPGGFFTSDNDKTAYSVRGSLSLNF